MTLATQWTAPDIGTWQPQRSWEVEAPQAGMALTDWTLLVIFLLGIYTGFSIQITTTIPFPAAISGVAGTILLWRRRHRVSPSGLAAFLGVTLLLLASILYAPGLDLLSKRTTGLLQMMYSLVISYALFLTVVEAGAGAFSRLMLVFIVTIVIGTVLESYAGLNRISDAVRLAIYHQGIYESDIRDEMLYGRVRPKLFTTEPSAVTFAYTLFSFCWLLTSDWRHKRLGYLAMTAAAMVAMPGPTLLLLVLLLALHELGPGDDAQSSAATRIIKLTAVGVLALVAFAIVGSTVYANRLNEIASGNDESFFYRVIGPFLVAVDVVKHHPILGVGLTGEQLVSDNIADVFLRSGAFSPLWNIPEPNEVLINYFFLHWVYLGLCGGIVLILAISGWLRALGVRALLMCWLAWAVLGQASGAYVSPKTWTVLFLIGACSVLHAQAKRRTPAPVPAPMEPTQILPAAALPPGPPTIPPLATSH